MDIRDGEVFRKYGSGVAQDEKLILVYDSFLRLGEVLDAEETPALANRTGVDLCTRTHDSSRIELEPHGKTSAMDFPQSDRYQRSVPRRQLGPCQLLLIQKLSWKLSQ